MDSTTGTDSELEAKIFKGIPIQAVYSTSDIFIVIEYGEIVESTCDAIVNAASKVCLGGKGVDGAITRAGGKVLADARKALPELDVSSTTRMHTKPAVC